jgi:acyl-CoA synthetase (AMP-forming)/AMP-acid ligase II
MSRFDAAELLGLVEQHRVTHTTVVPTMFARLMKLPPEVRDAADVSSLEAVVHGAAPCPASLKREVIRWLGPIVYEYYSSTEANGCTYCDSHEWLAHPGTVGRPVFGELLILDDDGRELGPGEEGTIWFRGSTNFEYFGDAAKTASSRDSTGTSSTVGDVGHVDAEGYLYLTDRRSHLIITGGVNVYPRETEDVLVTHPQVVDAAVIGVPHDDLGEEVRAVVQLMPGVAADDATATALIAFCREHVARFKCPRRIDFVDELPRMPSGKVAKHRLRERYAAG